MIKVFNSDDKTYETNGNVVLNPTYANIHKEDNGDYYLDLETSVEEDKIKHIEHEEGTTIETTGTTLTDVDTTKENKFTSLYGDTSQETTTGKNLIPNNATSQTINNVVFTKYSDGTIKANGTASAQVELFLGKSTLLAGNYLASIGLSSGASTSKYYVRLGEGETASSTFIANVGLNDNAFTLSSSKVCGAVLIIRSGIQVNNVIFKPMIRLSSISDDTYEPYTNGASPNPDYPQPIQVVTGRNDINVCGKNLIDTSKVYSYSIYTGTSTVAPTTGRYAYLMKVKPNTKYTFSRSAVGTASFSYLALFDNFIVGQSNTYTSATNVESNLTQTITTGAKTKYVMFLSGSGESTDIQLEEGETASTYEAYTGYTQEINLGKNLLNCTANTQTLSASGGTLTKNGDGTYTTSGGNTGTADLVVLGTINVENGKTYYLYNDFKDTNNNLSIRRGSTALVSTNTSNIISYTATATETLNVYLRYQSASTLTYKPMITKKYDTNFAPYFTPIELCKISTYQDYIYKTNDKWYIHKEIGKVVLDGSDSDNWNYTNACLQSGSTYPSDVAYPNASNLGLSDYFICKYYSSGITSNLTNGEYGWNSGKRLTLKLDNMSSKQDYLTWLSTHNTEVYYVLATPTDTEITDTTLLEQLNNLEKMRLYEGITNISITPNDLTPTLKLHYNYMTGGDVVINNNDYIKSNNIIVANTPTGEQAFRITDIEKRKHKIVLKAWHISYDTKNYVIQDSYVVDKTCNQAMDHLNNATDNTSPFTTTSDITAINSYRCVRKSLFEAFNVVLERWGGHFVRDNWNFKIMNSIGQDNGVVVRYAKNLKDIHVAYDWTNVVTKILPVGNDGLLLDEVFLYADIQYDIPYTKVVHFDQNINEDDYRDEQGVIDEDAYIEALKNDLRSQATLYLQNNYLPQVNYSLNANLEKITDIGDTIQVKDERLGVDITTNLISYDYDCILEKYTNLEFGNFTKTISDLTSYINSQTSQIVDESVSTTRITLENELTTATSQIWGVLGSSYVLNEGDKILIVDSLPKETATNVIMINSAGIGFSQTGINGTFSTALTIDGTFNTSNVNVINFTADLIKGGALKLGSNVNQNGILEVYDEANNLIALLNKDGLRMNAVNGDYVLINQNVGFAGYDRNDNKIYWADGDEFHMKKSVVEEEITLVDKMRIIPITITDGNNNIVNDGIGFVSTL